MAEQVRQIWVAASTVLPEVPCSTWTRLLLWTLGSGVCLLLLLVFPRRHLLLLCRQQLRTQGVNLCCSLSQLT